MNSEALRRLPAFIRRYFVPLCVASILFGSLSNILFALSGAKPYVTLWLLRQYYVNYIDFGFVRRGLIGTIVHPWLATAGNAAARGQLFVIAFDLAVFAALILLIRRLCNREEARGAALPTLVMAAFIVSPVGFQQFAWDIGRYDHINIVLLILSVWSVTEGRYALASALFAVTILIHEAAFFFGAGPIVIALFDRHARARDFALCIGPVLLVLAAVALWGNLSPTEIALLANRPGAATNVWSRGLFDPPPLALHPWEVIALLYYTIIPFAVLYGVVRHNGASLLRSFAPSLIVLLLFPLGFDYFRWAGLGFVSVAVTLIFMARTAGWILPHWRRAALILLLPYVLPLGPIGTEHPLYYHELIRDYR